ncbi:Gfo/Idh/MocA family protein [Streptomyces sp. NPDC052396]|uniref:Gfo/Idh/MocA family protein n=1 Tax=Streptomyces sp. NPDC052396 TaxID=3365689 RepID=UPI0037D94059
MRWGVAGYGDIVRRRVLPALDALGQETVHLWGRDAGRADRLAGRHGIPGSGDDFGRLLDGVDAVYVATPVAGHLPQALADAARGAGRLAAVAYYRRLGPAAALLRHHLGTAEPRQVRVEFRCAFAPGPGHPMGWRTDPAVSGGGVLADAGSHRLDLLLMALGRPLEIAARLDRAFPAGAERRAELRLRWASGTRAQLLAEWDEAPARDRVEIMGGEPAVVLDPLDEGLADNPHLPLIADFLAAVREGRRPACPVADAALVDEVISAAGRSSAQGGRSVRLGTR